jgi:hypothetical protein
MIGSVIWKYHDKMGHLGVEKLGELIKRQFYFSKMRERLKAHIEECMVCVAYNPNPIRKEVLLQKIDMGKGPFLNGSHRPFRAVGYDEREKRILTGGSRCFHQVHKNVSNKNDKQ